jgi:hypothetical protein
MMGVSSFDDLIKEGKATFMGDRKAFDQLLGLLVPFSPTFEVLPGTAPLPTAKTTPSDYKPGMAPPELAE